MMGAKKKEQTLAKMGNGNKESSSLSYQLDAKE
jgi:hypothetical protein